MPMLTYRDMVAFYSESGSREWEAVLRLLGHGPDGEDEAATDGERPMSRPRWRPGDLRATRPGGHR